MMPLLDMAIALTKSGNVKMHGVRSITSLCPG